MQRRNLLIGMGSLAAGGAATIGTGAFTSVEADRSVNVEVADDSSALLAITRDTRNSSETPNAKEYVDVSSTVSLDFAGTDSGSTGINDNATTVIDDLLTIENQGTQGAYIGYTHPASPNGNFALYHEDPLYDGDETNYDPSSNNYNNGGQLNIATAQDEDGDGNPDLVYLEPGEQLNHIGLFFFGSPNASAISADPITFTAVDEFSDL